MCIEFYSKKAYKKATNPHKYFNKEESDKINHRLSLLHQADNLIQIRQVKPLYLHKLKGSRSGQYAVRVNAKKRILFYPSGNYDLNNEASIKEIIIIEFNIDYH